MEEKTKILNDLLSQIELENIDKNTISIIAEPYKKVVYAGLSYLLDCYSDLSRNEELFEIQATYDMNKLKSYMKIGFTREEAFSLLMKSSLEVDNAVKSISSRKNNK